MNALVSFFDAMLNQQTIVFDLENAIQYDRLGVPNVSWNAPLDLTDAVDWPATEIGLPARLAGRPCRVLAATQAPPSMLSGHVAALRGQGVDVVLASQLLIDAALEAHAGPEKIDRAVRGLLRQQPASSAGARVST